jgi:cation diffusion facilitator CzcD-associated flavoprotein CzcO
MDAKWHLKVRDLERNRVIDDAVDVLYQCVGALNSWKWPDIPGRETFQGRMLHTADWDTSWDYTVQPHAPLVLLFNRS